MKTLRAELNRYRRLGVEHECFVPLLGNLTGQEVRQTIAGVLRANGIRAVAREYDRSTLPSDIDVAVETDRSVQGVFAFRDVRFAALEVKTRILTYDEWERVVPKTLGILKCLGADVNSSCGHHVHIGLPEVRQRPSIIRSLYNLIHRYEPVIIGGLVSLSRRGNGYCQAMDDKSKLLHGCRRLRDFGRVLQHHHKYFGLNMSLLFEDAPRCEFRYWNGTLNAEKARHILRFCLQMVEHAVRRSCQAGEQVSCDRDSLRKLLTACGFRPNSRIYSHVSKELRETGRHLLLKRFRKFHEQASPGICADRSSSRHV